MNRNIFFFAIAFVFFFNFSFASNSKKSLKSCLKKSVNQLTEQQTNPLAVPVTSYLFKKQNILYLTKEQVSYVQQVYELEKEDEGQFVRDSFRSLLDENGCDKCAIGYVVDEQDKNKVIIPINKSGYDDDILTSIVGLSGVADQPSVAIGSLDLKWPDVTTFKKAWDPLYRRYNFIVPPIEKKVKEEVKENRILEKAEFVPEKQKINYFLHSKF